MSPSPCRATPGSAKEQQRTRLEEKPSGQGPDQVRRRSAGARVRALRGPGRHHPAPAVRRDLEDGPPSFRATSASPSPPATRRLRVRLGSVREVPKRAFLSLGTAIEKARASRSATPIPPPERRRRDPGRRRQRRRLLHEHRRLQQIHPRLHPSTPRRHRTQRVCRRPHRPAALQREPRGQCTQAPCDLRLRRGRRWHRCPRRFRPVGSGGSDAILNLDLGDSISAPRLSRSATPIPPRATTAKPSRTRAAMTRLVHRLRVPNNSQVPPRSPTPPAT